jgi:TonB family protein
MKARLPLLICSLLLFVITANVRAQNSGAGSSEWKTYMIRGEEFSAAFPLLPAVDIKVRPLYNMNIKRKEVLVGCYADGVVYTVIAIENRPRRSLNDFIRENMGNGSSPATESDVTRDGISGKQFLYSENSGMVQYFAGKDRLYRFGASSLKQDDPRVKKFFESVKLGPPAADATEMMDGPGQPYEPMDEPADAATDVTTQKLLTGKEVDRKVRLAMKPEPMYTELARRSQITGTVVLKCVFSRNGNITNLRIVSALPNGLTENAIDAAKKIKFFPAMKDGKPVSMWMQLEYNFNLY